MRIERNDVVGLGRVKCSFFKDQRKVKRSCSDISSRKRKHVALKQPRTISKHGLQ
jgi:hypothetical protein